MRYQTKLLFVSGAMLFLSLFAAGMAYWGVERSNHYFKRSTSAHEQLEGYLRLSAHTYELFKQWSDAMLIGENALETARANLSRQIEADINLLRASVHREIAHVEAAEKDEEREELDRIAEIRKQLISILHEFGEIETLAVQGRTQDAKDKLAGILQQSIDTRFRYLIDQSIADEVREVIRVDQLASETHANLTRATEIHAALVTIFILACLYFLLRRLRQPLQELLGGTQALSSGDLTHRIRVSGHDEFAELGKSFNDMAADLASKRASLERIQNQLEDEVASRTEELMEANKALERVDMVRRRFFADISHELRTPLTVIRGEGQITLRGKDKTVGEYKSALDRIVEQAKHLGILVNDLLFIAREGVGELQLKRDDVAIADLLEAVCGDMRVVAREKNIELNFTGIEQTSVYSGDEGRLRQLFLILLDNAICYSKPGSRIDVTIERSGDGVQIAFADQGIGIAEEELDIVFERFGRGSNAQVQHAEGIGLGLPLAKSIAEAHGGEIKIASAKDQGTTVTLSFAPVRQLEIAS